MHIHQEKKIVKVNLNEKMHAHSKKKLPFLCFRRILKKEKKKVFFKDETPALPSNLGNKIYQHDIAQLEGEPEKGKKTADGGWRDNYGGAEKKNENRNKHTSPSEQMTQIIPQIIYT